MAKFEAGTAYVQVVPSMRGFHDKVGKALKDSPAQMPVTVDTESAEQSLRQFSSRVGSLSSFLQVEANTDKARADIQDLVAKRRTAEVGIEVTRNQLDAQLDALSLTQAQSTIGVDADTARAQEQIRKLQAERITGEVNYDAAITNAENRIRELQMYQDSESQRLLAEIGQAQARLAEYWQELENTDYNTAAFNDLVNRIDYTEAQIDKLTEQQHSVGVQVEADTAQANAEIAEATRRWDNEQVRIDVGVQEADFRQRRAEDTNTASVVRVQAQTSQAQARIEDLVSQRYTTTIDARIRDEQAQAQLAALAQQADIEDPIEVGVDIAQAQQALRKLESRRLTGEVDMQATVERAQEQIRQLEQTRLSRTMRIDADVSQAETELANLRRHIADVEAAGQEPVELRAEADRVEATLRELQEQRASVDVEIDTNIEQANREIETARARWESEKVKLDLDTQRAREKLEDLQAQVNNLSIPEGFQRGTSWVLGLTAAISALGAAAPAAAGAVAAIPTALTGLAQVTGTVAAGFHGVTDAAQQYNEVQTALAAEVEPTEDQLKDLTIAMSQLTEEGQTFARFLVDDVKPALSGIGDGVQTTLLPQLQDSLTNLLGIVPQVDAALTDTGDTLGDLAVRGSEMISSGPWTRDFQTITATNNQILSDLGNAGLMLADALRSITVAAGPLLQQFAEWAQNQAILFNGMVQTARGTGQLQTTMETAASTIGRFIDMAMQLGQAALDLLAALSPVGEVVLDWVSSFSELVGWLADTSPLLLQIGAGALLIAGSMAKARRGVRGIGTMLQQATGGLIAFGDASQRTNRRSSNFTRGLTRIGNTLPIVGFAVTAFALTMDSLATSTGEATDALLQGGRAAQQLRADLNSNDFFGDLGFLEIFGGPGQAVQDFFTTTTQEAQKAAQKRLASMGELQRAQTLATRAENNYLLAVRQHGPQSRQAATASRQLSTAQQNLERLQRLAAKATQSHTEKLRAQRRVMLGSAQADLAFRQSKLQVTQAQRRLNQALNRHGKESRQVRQAEIALEQAMLRSVQAAGRAARANFENQRSAKATKAALAAQNREVIRLIGIMGAQAPPALLAMAAKMDQAALSATGARIETDKFGNSILILPNGKRVNISTPGVQAAIGNVNTLQSDLNNLDLAKTVTISVNRVFKNLGEAFDPSGVPFPNARGNIVQFARGGLAPMDSIASIVPPNTWRVVGDRMVDDEAYIPINDSRRSQRILTETASRMGYALLPSEDRPVAPAADGGLAVPYSTATLPLTRLPDAGTGTETATRSGDIYTTVHARTEASPEHIAYAINRHVDMQLRH